jgi:alkylated DNA repair dioxygenase AlkB
VVTSQLSLLPDVSLSPAGLQYRPDFVSERDEHDLVQRIRSLPLQPFQFGAFLGKRRVAWFGWRYDYSQQKLQQAEALPAWIAPVIARLEAFGDLPAGAIRQVLFTQYEAGAGIGWHRDKPHFEKVFGLSLLSPAGSDFAAGRKAAGSVIRSPPRRARFTKWRASHGTSGSTASRPWSRFATR